jgi:histidine ammonia-lyase
MGATSALKLRQVVDNVEQIMAIELFCAAQGIDFRRRRLGADTKLGAGTRDVYGKIREVVPFIEHDEYMKGHMDAVLEIVRTFRPNIP